MLGYVTGNIETEAAGFFFFFLVPGENYCEIVHEQLPVLELLVLPEASI